MKKYIPLLIFGFLLQNSIYFCVALFFGDIPHGLTMAGGWMGVGYYRVAGPNIRHVVGLYDSFRLAIMCAGWPLVPVKR